MATDTWVDDDYYVGEDGAMVKNDWRKTFGEDEEDDPDQDEHWYYFGSNGKKVTDQDKKINGKITTSTRMVRCTPVGTLMEKTM